MFLSTRRTTNVSESTQKDYQLYAKISFCSNVLQGVGPTLVMVDQTHMLKVAYGVCPLIWLMAPADQQGEKWVPIVGESESLHKDVKVEKDDINVLRIDHILFLYYSNLPLQDRHLLDRLR